MVTAKKKLPVKKDKELAPILNELSHDPDIKLDQIKSLIIMCVTFKMFPGGIVERSIKYLKPYKRQQAINSVSIVLHNACWSVPSIVYSIMLTYTVRLKFNSIPDQQDPF